MRSSLNLLRLSYFDKYGEVLNTYDDLFLLVKQVFVRNMQPPEAEAGFDVWVPPFTDMPAFERRIAEEWAPSCRNLTYKVSEYCNLSLLLSQNKWKCTQRLP
jgi:hypothetical protein